MSRPPKQSSRRNNPDFSPVTAQIAKDLGKRLRLFVIQQETTISEVVEKALKEYLDKNQRQQATGQPRTIAEFVQQNYWRLQSANIKNIDAIALGQQPTRADLARICSTLKRDFEGLQALTESSFPESSNFESEELPPKGWKAEKSKG